ncbi:MAG: XdhC family protein [Flavobacteriales bacterium]|nr:XdhC family protein [Flavobacteriales bacterium]
MNNQLDLWQRLLHAVRSGERCVLLTVVESIGSSPGRMGFSMFVTENGTMHGSIGGGSMEQKLVELARSLMDRPAAFPFLKRQVHREGEARDRSGMICSGEQTVAFHLIGNDQEALLGEIVAAIETNSAVDLELGSSGIHLVNAESSARDPEEVRKDPAPGWSYRRPLKEQPRIAIIGGGHVGTALSRTMNQLGFHVMQFDHRDKLNTMEANTWAHEKDVVDFERIEEHVPDDPDLYIAIVSFGYRTDEIVLRRLLRRQWKYLGMLGSKAKVETMFANLLVDGFTEEELWRVHTPIGLAINSRTPEEIAVSIAAEIIRVKNT